MNKIKRTLVLKGFFTVAFCLVVIAGLLNEKIFAIEMIICCAIVCLGAASFFVYLIIGIILGYILDFYLAYKLKDPELYHFYTLTQEKIQFEISMMPDSLKEKRQNELNSVLSENRLMNFIHKHFKYNCLQ